MKLEIEATDLVGAAAAIDAASRAGLFAALLGGGPATAEELCARLGVDPRGLSVVIDILFALGLVSRDPSGRLTVGAEIQAMEARMPGSLMVAGALFAGAPALLKSGTPVTVMDGGSTQRSAAYRGAVSGLAGLFATAASDFAEAIGPVSGELLDVGCGSGVWSLALAARNPALGVTGLDLPGVVEVFERHAAEAGLGGRARAWPADANEVSLPEGAFDLVLIANVLRLEPADRARGWVGRLARAVRPGGRLVVIDALAGGAPGRDVARAVYGLHLALRTTSGTVHPASAIDDWMREAGLIDAHGLDFGAHPGAVAARIARRPL